MLPPEGLRKKLLGCSTDKQKGETRDILHQLAVFYNPSIVKISATLEFTFVVDFAPPFIV
jgi:hypothetical protein